MAGKTSKRHGGLDGFEPHSWEYDNWPEAIWPNDGERARWVVRSNRHDLIAEGALSRVGKKIVILGKGYTRWLARQADRVAQFDSNLPHLRRD